MLSKKYKNKPSFLTYIFFVLVFATLGTILLFNSHADTPCTSTKAADINCDTKVNITDLSIFLSNYGKTTTQLTNSNPSYPRADINNSGRVDIGDLSLILSSYGQSGGPVVPTDTNAKLGFNTLNSAASDDFTGNAGTKPDAVRWGAKTFTASNGSVVYWDGFNNVQLDGAGNLDIFAERNIDGTSWNSSWISGNKSYSGSRYMEARAKVAGGMGPWSAPIWEWDAPYGTKGVENDVIEQLGIEPSSYHTTLHTSGSNQVGKNNTTSSVLANAYHTYGAAVYADRVDYYLDGVKIQTITKTETGGVWGFVENPMVLNINLDMGGWGGTPSGALPGTVHMLVDYIRVYTP